MARSVWALAPEENTELISNIQEPSACAWLAVVFETLPHDDLTRIIVTSWALWHTAEGHPRRDFPKPLVYTSLCGEVYC
jgi:hypothetical protein